MAQKIPAPPAAAHKLAYRVPYSETDAMGRVYYANYLLWFERGRTEMLRDLGYAYRDLESAGLYLPVRHCQTRYLGYAVYDDELTLLTWISKLARARLEFSTLVYAPGKTSPITYGVVELVCVNQQAKPQPFPAEIHAALAEHTNL